MLIYLLRHAIAVARTEAELPNDDRPLTKEGREKMIKAAEGIDRLLGGTPPDVILTSPLVRARDTALIAAEAMGCKEKIEVCPELLPGVSYSTLIAVLAKRRDAGRIMLVGHSPDLNYTASALLESEASIVELKKGALCCIEIASLTGRTQGRMLWLLQPKHLRQIAQSRMIKNGEGKG